MRYVIKKQGEGYFTEMGIIETKAVYLNGNLMGHENVFRPLFEAFKPQQGSHFDTELDANEQMADARFGGPASFADCVVEATET